MSRYGRTVAERLLERAEPITETGCWIWLGFCNADGYGIIGVNGKISSCHRTAWQEFIGSIPDGMQVLHRCDVRSCLNPKHLFLGSQQDNIYDMIAKGRDRHPRGAENSKTKLNPEIVLAIRASDESGPALAKKYKVSVASVWAIRHRKNWKHVR